MSRPTITAKAVEQAVRRTGVRLTRNAWVVVTLLEHPRHCIACPVGVLWLNSCVQGKHNTRRRVLQHLKGLDLAARDPDADLHIVDPATFQDTFEARCRRWAERRYGKLYVDAFTATFDVPSIARYGSKLWERRDLPHPAHLARYKQGVRGGARVRRALDKKKELWRRL